MRRLVGIYGNINSGRSSIAAGFITDGWYITDVKTDIANGTDPVVAVQKALVAVQGVTSDIIISGLINLAQFQVLLDFSHYAIFIERPELEVIANPLYPSVEFQRDLQYVRGSCHSIYYNVKDILTSQMEVKQIIQGNYPPIP